MPHGGPSTVPSARATPASRSALFSASAMSQSVRVETITAAPGNKKVERGTPYAAQVTLSIENADGSLTPSGWSTRKEGGGDGSPFTFTPGVNLIQGWTDGVLQMREGERAKMHVPHELGYGAAAQGSKGGAWYIPGSSNLLFDIEIIGKAGAKGPAKEEL